MRHKLLYFLIFLALVSCGTGKQAVQTVNRPVLPDSLQQQFDYFFYEGLRLKESSYDQAFENFKMCYAINPSDAGLLYQLGMIYYDLNDAVKSMNLLEKAVSLDPKEWSYQMFLLALYGKFNQKDSTIVLAKRIQKNFPNMEQAHKWAAYAYKENGMLDDAIKAYQAIEKINGIEEATSMQKIELYFMKADLKNVEKEFNRLINRYPNNSFYKLFKGDYYFGIKKLNEAFDIYTKVLQEDPDNPNVYLSLSDYYTEVGQPEKAIEAIESALKHPQLEVEKKLEVLSEFIPQLLADSSRTEQTESLFKLLVDHYPLEEEVHSYYTKYLIYKERYAEAIEEIETMLIINPQNFNSWSDLLSLTALSNDTDSIEQVIDRAMRELPERYEWYQSKSYLLLGRKQYIEAIDVLLAGLKFVKDNQTAVKSDFYSIIGDICYQLGWMTDTYEAYEMALKANPNNVQVLNNYAYFLSLERQNIKRAEFMSAKTVELEPSNSTFLDTYAWVLFVQGNYSLAKFYIERAVDNLDKDYDSWVIYDHYGDILWKLGQTEKAIQMWQKALESGQYLPEVANKLQNGI